MLSKIEIHKLRTKKSYNIVPGPCELTIEVPEEEHGLGDFTPDEVPGVNAIKHLLFPVADGVK